MVESMMYDESQSEIIAKAQAQVDIVCSCGKQLIEELAAGGEAGNLSQKVSAVTTAAEAAIAAAAGHIASLGPLLQAAAERPTEATKIARTAILQKRKDALQAGQSASPPAVTDFAGRSEGEVLELIVQRVASASGLLVELRGPSGASRAAAAAALDVHVKVEGVLSAMVALAAAGRPEAARVVLMSAEETASGKNAWDTSDHQVFRRASDVAMQALAYFAERAQSVWSQPDPETSAAGQLAASSALEDLLLYLSTYRDLFTRPCSATGKFLALDPVSSQLLPPIVRPFRRSRSELLAMANGAEPCQAFHPHVGMPTEEVA